MTARASSILLAVLAVALGACKNDSGPSCSLDGGTQLAATSWPKFRADAANTGRTAVDMSANDGTGRRLFPTAGTPTPTTTGTIAPTATMTMASEAPGTATASPSPNPTAVSMIGPVETTPILGPDLIFIASSDGNVYVIDHTGRPIVLDNDIQMGSAILGSPLLGADGTLFVAGNGVLSTFDVQNEENLGNLLTATMVLGFVAASPNIWDGDGTVFVASQAGIYEGVCPNGVQRYSLTFPSTQSTVAIVQDPNVDADTNMTPIIVAGGVNGQVRAFNIRARQFWSFFASADVNAAIVVDETINPATGSPTFFVADSIGGVFAGALTTGKPVPGFMFTAESGISASPALGRDTATVPVLYVADLGGTLYAIERATGRERWRFHAGGAIKSSPAVAIGGAKDVIVFGADDGVVYALEDEGASHRVLWTFDVGAPIGASSPSIDSDGSVYIGAQGGAQGGAVYVIGPGAGPTPTATPAG